MARRYRIFITNLPFLVFLGSIDGITLFKEKEDYEYFLVLLKGLSKKYLLDIHSYMLLENSIYFLGTPKNKDSLVKFMQSLARSYTTYFNKKYNRKGTIWSGRYKASLVEEKSYFLDVMIYIESLQKSLKKDSYSSMSKNLLNKESDFIVEHTIYKELGANSKERSINYSAIFNSRLNSIHSFEFIKKNLEKQLVIGTLPFVKKIEQAIGKTLRAKKRGRPKKNQKKRKKMYKNLVVLDKSKHADLKLNQIEDLNFAKELSFCPVVAKELEQMAQLFPVVFSGDEENPTLVSLLSLGTQNLAINSDGKWIGSYVPSFIRRYPFSLASSGENSEQKIVLIDEESNLFSTTNGEELFTKDGEQTEQLKNAINFLTVYDNEITITNSVVKSISQSGILETREITVGEGDEKKVLVKGFQVVDREKLNQLSDEVLADWTRRGIINLIEVHLKSLNNIKRLFTLITQQQK